MNYYFNEETIEYFKELPKEIVYQEIKEFVENNCQLENDETYEDLSKSLYNQVL